MKPPRFLSTTQPALQGQEDVLEAVRRQTLAANLLTGLGGGLAVVAAGAAALAVSMSGGNGNPLPVLSAWMGASWVSIAALAVVLALAAVLCILRGRQSLHRSLDAANHQVEALSVERALTRQEAQARQEDAERRLVLVQASGQACQLAVAVHDEGRLLSQTADLLQKRFGLTYAGIYLAEAQGGAPVLRAAAGAGAQEVLAGGRAPADPQQRLPRPAGARSELELPVTFQERRLGAIILQSAQLNAFAEEDGLALQSIAAALACRTVLNWQEARLKTLQALPEQSARVLAQENARLVEQMERRARQEQLVNEIAAQAESSLNLDAVLRTAAQELGLALGGARVQVSLGSPVQAEDQPSGGEA